MKASTSILVSILIFILIGIAGKYERAEEIVHNMPESTYQKVASRVGSEATEIQIAEEYMNNRSIYDSHK